MVDIIPPNIKKFYDTWNVQSFVLLSLSLHIILILFAPFRKRTANGVVIWLIWSAYLLADWVANFAVGLISHRKYHTLSREDDADILAFWSPFLLLHLGGPDAITASALEDNTLWLRHMVGFITQLFTTIIVFGQSLPRNKLWLPTVLLFIAGTVKYVERTRALYLANLNTFRKSMLKEPDPGPDYAKLIEAYTSKRDAQLPTQIEILGEGELNKESKAPVYAVDEGDLKGEIEVVQHAYHFFQIFKGLIVDLTFSFRERQESRLFFQHRNSKDALTLIAVELNFIYEVLYTKVVTVRSRSGCILRVISLSAVMAAVWSFYSLDSHGFREIDVNITRALLFGAICSDTIALIMLAFSDWTALSLRKLMTEGIHVCPMVRCFHDLLGYFLIFKRINWPRESPDPTNCLDWARRILFRRWSEYLYTFNFIDYCLKEVPKTTSLNVFDYLRWILISVIKFFGLKDFYDKRKYVSKKPVTKELWDFIFNELQKKSHGADDLESGKRICANRGGRVLQNSEWNSDSTDLMSYIVGIDYDQSLMLLHIATELCYTMNTVNNPDDSREICKDLSDYMLYLLVMQPTMMSAVAAVGQFSFRDTCADAKRFFGRKGLGSGKLEEEHERACERILEVKTDVLPSALKGINRSKTVLFDACILAKELQKLDRENPDKKWKLMSEVWVELLSHAAGHCRANIHAAQLSKGGEIITFVWLLMAQLGIGEQFQIYENHAIAKLIMGK